jgi:hypothetical protein
MESWPAVRVVCRLIDECGTHPQSWARESFHMPATGELIRLMNYVDDINATLRRISFAIPTMSPEERKRLSEYMSSAANGFNEVLQHLEQVTK